MSMTRRFHGEPVSRLIISVPLEVVHRIDEVARGRHPARGNRSEFIRLAIDEKLEWERRAMSGADLMIFPAPKETVPFENNPDQSNGQGKYDGAPGEALRTDKDQAARNPGGSSGEQ